MKTIKLLTAILGAMCILSSCKKDDKPSKTDMLTAKAWKTTAMTINPGIDFNHDGTLETDMLSVQQECEKDNLIKFGKDNTVTNDEGATKCDPNDPQTSPGGNWSLNANETKVIITGMNWFEQQNQTVTFSLIELTSSTLKCSTVARILQTDFTLNITMVAQ